MQCRVKCIGKGKEGRTEGRKGGERQEAGSGGLGITVCSVYCAGRGEEVVDRKQIS